MARCIAESQNRELLLGATEASDLQFFGISGLHKVLAPVILRAGCTPSTMGNLARMWSDEISPSVSAQTPARTGKLESLAQDLLVGLGATGIAIARENANEFDSLICVVSVGSCAPAVGARLDPNSGISGRCVRECRTQTSYDTRIDPRVERSACERLGIRSVVVVPLLADSHCIGLIEAFSDQPGHFDADKVSALEQAAAAVIKVLGTQEHCSEQPISLLSPPPFSAAEEQLREVPVLNSGVSQEPEVASAVDKAAASPNSESIPKFLESQQSEVRNFPLRWPAIVLIMLVAGVAGTRILRTKRPTQFALPPTAANDATANLRRTADVSPGANSTTATPSISRVTSPDGFLPVQPVVQRAEHGDVAAQMDLAQAYLTGDNLPQDRAKAVSWYIIAGENGSAEAKHRAIEVTRGMAPFQIAEIRYDVGKMYMKGVGTHSDYVSAYSWFELAKAAGDIRAQTEETLLEQKMEPGQVQQARKQASEWLHSHSRNYPNSHSKARQRN